MSDVSDLYTVDDDGVVVAVHVQPRAGRGALVGRHGRALKLRVAAPPVDERANEAAAAVLADAFDVPVARVELVAGSRSRLKRFRLQGVSGEDFEPRVRRLLDLAAEPEGPRRRRGE